MIDKDEIPEMVDLMLRKLQEIERRVGVLEQVTRVGWPYSNPDYISGLADRVGALEKTQWKHTPYPILQLPPLPALIACTQHPGRKAIRQILIETLYGPIPTASFCEECYQLSYDQKQAMIEACYAKYAEENKELLKKLDMEVIFPMSEDDGRV